MNSQPEAVVMKEAKLKGLELDGVKFEVMTREKKRTANFLASANLEKEMTTSEFSTQTHCDYSICTRASLKFKATTMTPMTQRLLHRLTICL